MPLRLVGAWCPQETVTSRRLLRLTHPLGASHRGGNDVAGPDGLCYPDSCATIVAMSIEALRTVRDHFSDIVDRVEREHDRVTVTRNGRPAVVLLSTDDLAQLEETLDVLSDPEALSDIREADAAYARGDVVRGADAVRALLT